MAERKRLAAELKASGDKAGAKQVEKLARPSISAWAVNQLWWQQRASFEALFEGAGRLRSGDLGAMRAHRAALDGLRTRAAELLRAGSHATSEAVMRRVGTTLAALAAAGGFEPDLPGALSADREAPGFGATGLSDMLAAARPEPEPSEPPAAALGTSQRELDAEHERREQERQRIEQQRAAARAEQERAAARAEQQRLQVELQRAREDSTARAREVERLRTALEVEAQALERARDAVKQLEARLESLAGEGE